MKRTILTLTIAASLISLAPVLHARDFDDYQSDVHSLWEWYGHLQNEAAGRGGHHIHEELDGIHNGLEDVDHQLHDRHFHGDRVRGELDGLRDQLRHVSEELHWHGEIHHRQGFTIEIH